jgi:hypothetical protein
MASTRSRSLRGSHPRSPWLYPLITDGLALVAYAATARLTGSSARYAWIVVVLAAGLSGLAQASFLAADPIAPAGGPGEGPVFATSAALRFGVGAWPAIAAAIVAHLLYLLLDHTGHDQSNAVEERTDVDDELASAATGPTDRSERPSDVQSYGAEPATVQLSRSPAGAAATPVQRPALPSGPGRVAPSGASSTSEPEGGRPVPVPVGPVRAAGRSGESPARDRARAHAAAHFDEHGDLPTVTQLMTLAEVSRGTAGEALKALRELPTPLHLVTDHPTPRTQP